MCILRICKQNIESDDDSETSTVYVVINEIIYVWRERKSLRMIKDIEGERKRKRYYKKYRYSEKDKERNICERDKK